MNKIIMNDFRKKISKRNASVQGFLFSQILALIMVIIGGSEKDSPNDAVRTDGFYMAMIVILIVSAANSFISRYTVLYNDDAGKTESKIFGREDLLAIMRYHGFDLSSYFGGIVLRFIPLQLISAVLTVCAGIAGLIPSERSFFSAALIVILPWPVFLLRYAVALYDMQHIKGLFRKIAGALAKMVYGMARVVAVAISMITMTVLAIAMITHSVLFKDIDDTQIIRISSGGGVIIIVIVILVIFLGMLITDIDRDSFAVQLPGKRNVIAAVTAVLTAAAIGTAIFITCTDNVKLTPDSISVKKNGIEKVYTADDITSYKIFGTDGIRMELKFSDGSSAEIFRDTSDDTSVWSERYYSDYNYAAELVEKLAERGVSGSLEDRKDLDKYVQILDPECREGYEAILKYGGF